MPLDGGSDEIQFYVTEHQRSQAVSMLDVGRKSM